MYEGYLREDSFNVTVSIVLLYTGVTIMLVFFTLCILSIIIFIIYSTKKPKNYPPGPKWYPIVGSLPQLKQMIKKYGGFNLAIEKLSEQYNTNILGLKLGSNLVIVAVSHPVIKEILLDGNYDARPKTFFLKLRTMGTGKGITCSEGEFWSIQRTFVTKHLRRIGYDNKIMELKIREEAQEILKIIELNKGKVEFDNLISPSVLNVLWCLAAGTEITRTNPRLIKLLNILSRRTLVFDMSGSTLNYFPWMRFFAPEKTGYNLIKSLNLELKELIMETINEHVSSWTEGQTDDLIYAYITKIKEANGHATTFSYEQLIMVCLDLFIAGSTTTSSTLNFAFLSMILYPKVQKKVQAILDQTFGKEGFLEYTDKCKVPYIEAVILEVQRYYAVLPIIGPRKPLQETVLDGYKIPEDSTILLCLNSLHRNSEFFEDPNVFRPERFLNENNELIHIEAFMPFGLGKRRCLGDYLAKKCIYIFFTEILRNYKITLLPGSPMPSETPVPGITGAPQKYSAQLIKRL